MAFSAKTVRKQLQILSPLMSTLSLKSIRKGQDKVGELMESRYRSRVHIQKHPFAFFEGAWVLPQDERREGVLLYLHGGGYTCGGLDYATGYGSMLAEQTGTKVFCAAYRLAPEHRFPAAVEDALEAYRYLLDKGYAGDHIALCGESAGGGLCYALCLKLKEEGLPLPCGIIAISPWVDLTGAGPSYEQNRAVDPSMTKGLLDFFADSYTGDRTHPLASPLFGDLADLPPSLIYAGGDEIMLSDAESLHQKLLETGGKSRLIIGKERWHAYPLYGLEEDRKEVAHINKFLNQVLSNENKQRWMRLDNAAKIYPAARRQNWSNVFRISATLQEAVDLPILQQALDITARRFPSIAVRLRRGVFWYSLQQLAEAPPVMEDGAHPLMEMGKDEIRRCAFRVLVYRRRIAVEFFHSITDGTGAMIFVKTLVAEYLRQKYGAAIPAENGVLGRLEEPSPEELEDSFQKHVGNISASRKENTAWHLSGTPEKDGFLNLTCMELPVKAVLETAHKYNVSLTAFLCAAMMEALQRLQRERVPDRRRRKPIKVLIPVNLRSLFPSRSLRNFAMYTTPELLPRLGDYSFEEICAVVRNRMEAEITPKQMSMKIATNVNSERILPVRILPLFIKNIVMKAIFDTVGERKSCLTISNLGAVRLPQEMVPFIQRMDFILGVQASAPHNVGVLSFGDTLYINFIRNTVEPDLEYRFYRVLQEFGLPVKVQSNRR